VFGQRPRADLQHHRAQLAGRVIILLQGINDSLSRGEIYRAPTRDRISGCSALRRMFALGFDGDFLLAENV
jgi:hypothetical protein